MRTVNIGLLGAGTIGKGVYDSVISNGDVIAARSGLNLAIKVVCDKDPEAVRALNVDPEKTVVTSDSRDIIENDDIDVVVELIGGIEPARELILSSLRAKKHVVTANKALLSKCWKEIFPVALENNVSIKFEASVAGAIPVIRAIQQSFVANNINTVYGILNGTTNYILTEMDERGVDFQTALNKAQELGFAESDPTLDVTGMDSAHKLAILAFLCYGIEISPEDIYTEGIERIDPYDIDLARSWGYSIKLLAIAKQRPGGIQLRVHPSLVSTSHLISSVKGEDNAVFIDGDLVGSSLFYGKGAGAYPTASSVIGDIVDVASKRGDDRDDVLRHLSDPSVKLPEMLKMEKTTLSYYLRFSVIDRPGVLADISKHLAANDISIASVTQQGRSQSEGVPVVILTHEALERDMTEAIAKIDRESYVTDKTVIIRKDSD